MLEHILIVALFTLGYCCTFWEGMIFARIGDWMDLHAPQWLWKPLGGCYICASMWIGSVVYWLLYSDRQPGPMAIYTVNNLHWFITCVGAMGINAFISFVSRIGENKEG